MNNTNENNSSSLTQDLLTIGLATYVIFRSGVFLLDYFSGDE